MFAIRLGNLTMVELFVEHGASLEIENDVSFGKY